MSIATSIPVISSYPMPSEAQLPFNLAPWKVDPQRAALLIHDMQQYFVDFLVPQASPALELVANISAIRAAARRAAMPVFYTAQPGAMTRAERGLLYDMWGPGMSAEPHHRRIIAELAPQPPDVVLTKWRYSAFTRSDLAQRLACAGRDQLIVCGIYAHVGVMTTVCDAYGQDIEPFLIGDAIADFTPDYHRLAMNYVAGRCGVVLSTKQLLGAM